MTGRSGLLIGLAALAAVAGCREPEEILPGQRLAVDAVFTEVPGQDDGAAEAGAADLSIGAPLANSEWPQSPVSPDIRVGHAALPGGLSPAWQVSIGAGDSRRKRILADPVVGGGRIFTIDADHSVSAVSPQGAVLWQTSLVPPRDGPQQGQGGGLAYADGTVFASSGFGTLTAIDAETGAVTWTQDLDNTATGAPGVAGGLVYVTSGDRTGWAVEADTGRVRWQVDGVGDVGNVAGAPAPAVSGDRVVFAFGDGSLRATFAQGGLGLWSAELAGQRTGVARALIDDVTGDPVIAGDTVYAGSHSGRLIALNVYDGERLWTQTEGALGPVWPVGGSVFFVSDRNALIRADAATGAILWSRALPGYEPSRNPNRRRDAAFVNHGPILAGGRLLVAGSDGVLRAFDPQDGAPVAETPIPGGATTRPVVAGGTLYVVTRRGELVAYR